ncbi:hypothetical protein ACV229_00980 [Burkholderia sp. MR1-5-21]
MTRSKWTQTVDHDIARSAHAAVRGDGRIDAGLQESGTRSPWLRE